MMESQNRKRAPAWTEWEVRDLIADFSSHSLKTCYKYLNQTSWSFAAIIQALNGDLCSSDFPHDGNVMAELCLYITDPTEDISYQAREGIYQFLMNQRERETPERS
ncbi:unnamed protein product [Caretta caretta]